MTTLWALKQRLEAVRLKLSELERGRYETAHGPEWPTKLDRDNYTHWKNTEREILSSIARGR
jgi:hypothetical protein